MGPEDQTIRLYEVHELAIKFAKRWRSSEHEDNGATLLILAMAAMAAMLLP